MEARTPNTFRDVIALWPSRVLFADAIGVSHVNGHMMWRRDTIPYRHFDAVSKAADMIGHPGITNNLLIRIAAEKKRQQDATRALKAEAKAKRQRRKPAKSQQVAA